jgi:hypothetical protein
MVRRRTNTSRLRATATSPASPPEPHTQTRMCESVVVSRYRVTLSFDMAIDDDQVLERIADVQDQLIDADSEPESRGRVSVLRRLRRQHRSRDPRRTFNMAAVAMLSEGAAKVPGLTITQLSVRSEASGDR